MIFFRLFRSLRYRLAKDEWHQLAIHYAYSGYKGHSVHLKELNIEIKEGEFLWLLEGYLHALKIAGHGGRFKIEDSKLYLEFNGIKICIQTAEELFIVREIFINLCYEFYVPQKKVIVIDIGMNVGLASLFFSMKQSVNKIYAYEPFTPTLEQAKINFEMNPSLASKVQLFNVGWGAANTELEVEYTPSHKGRVGVVGRELVPDRILDVRKEYIQIVDSAKLLSFILAENPKACVIMKMDCEGAEFDIVGRLNESGLLKSISVMMIEWHAQEPSTLIHDLVGAGFKLFNFDQSTHVTKVGMLYAVNCHA